MKRILLALLLIPSLAFAGPEVTENDLITDPKTGNYILGRMNENGSVITATEGDAIAPSFTSRGGLLTSSNDPASGLTQSVIPLSTATGLNGVGVGLVGWGLVGTDTAETGTTTTVINATSHAAKVGDIIWINGGTAVRQWAPVSAIAANTITVSHAFTAAPANGDQFFIQRPIPVSTTNNTNNAGQSLATFLDSSYQQAATTGLLKLEDSAHVSTDAGVQIFGVSNPQLGGGLVGSTNDYTPLATNVNGALYTHLWYDNSAFSAVTLEDKATASADAGIPTFAKIGSALSVDGANGDYGLLKGDLTGRLITAPAVAEETWQSCATGITTTARSSVKLAVASNRIYVASLVCGNSSAVPTFVTLEDGTTQIGTGYLKAGDNLQWTFPVPLRTSVNTAFNVSLNTTGTSTNCCAAGYISVN